jgi:UDP-glucose:(heptosyl)LPS alpha-1,3-glucosyltransferase
MQVALVIERMDKWRGGAETSTVQFAQHLARMGCAVHVLTTSHVPSTPDLKVITIPVARSWGPLQTWLFIRRASIYLRRHPFDIVHSLTPCPVADVYEPRGGTLPETLERNLALRSPGLKRWWKHIQQKTRPKYMLLSRLEQQVLKRSPRPWVIAISQYVRKQLERHYHYDPDRLQVIFNGVDPDRSSHEQRGRDRWQIRRDYHMADDDVILLCVAHNFRLKGIPRAIEALGCLKNDSCMGRLKLIIAGRDNPSGCGQLVQELGLDEHIKFAGPTQRIDAFYHAADVLVHPTYYDPCSRVVLEAMSSGLPVITTRYNGAAELITDGEQGYVLEEPDRVDVLADRIRRLTDDEHRRACNEKVAAVTERISMHDHASRVRKLYERILKEKG